MLVIIGIGRVVVVVGRVALGAKGRVFDSRPG